MSGKTSTLAPAERTVRRLAGGVLLLGVLAAYANSFSGPFVFDDLQSIAENTTIRRLGDLGLIFAPQDDGGITVGGRPMVNLSFAVNYALGGTAVAGYHAVNLTIHLLAAAVLFGIVRRTLSQPTVSHRFDIRTASVRPHCR